MEWILGLLILMVGSLILVGQFKKHAADKKKIEAELKKDEKKTDPVDAKFAAILLEIGKVKAAYDESLRERDRSIEYLASEVNKINNEIAANRLAQASARPPVFKFPDKMKIEVTAWPPMDLETAQALKVIFARGKVVAKPRPTKEQAERTKAVMDAAKKVHEFDKIGTEKKDGK